MVVYDVKISALAESDLRDIARYISSGLNAPETALNMIKTIKACRPFCCILIRI